MITSLSMGGSETTIVEGSIDSQYSCCFKNVFISVEVSEVIMQCYMFAFFRDLVLHISTH